ncbi:MAG: hypothetical protein WAQ57_03730 [Candidatus Saccharimonadales bacterium]
MLKLHRFRPEDYWLIAVSVLAILFFMLALYAGTLKLRILGFVLGLPGIVFTTYIIRRSYSLRRAKTHLAICLVSSSALALGLHLLTN